jgi:D-alanyl-D-alanine carboxypeptidase (penicillin-binding protein 5/6)
MERLPMNKVVTAVDYQSIPGESLMGLEPGQEISVRDLMYGLILLSGNDAAATLAVAVSGSESRFVRLMNRTARRLGLDDTSYENPIGLDNPRQFSSARDLVELGSVLMAMPRFRPIAGARSATLRSYRPPIEIETSNEFVRDNPWAKGIKTGRTNLAGYVLASDGRREATELIAAVMGTSSEAARDAETVELMDFGFSLYDKRVPIRTGRPVTRVPVRYEDQDLPLVSPRAVRVGVREGEDLTVSLDVPAEVEGPIERGQLIGRATVVLEGETLATVPLRAGRPVAEPGLLVRGIEAFTSNLVYIAGGVLVLLAVALLFRRRQEREMRRRMSRVGRRRR